MNFFSRVSLALSERSVHFHSTRQLKTTRTLKPMEMENVGQAGSQRQREYATGRWCARQALAGLRMPLQAIGHGPEGEPLWPSGVCGSISHTRGACCAAVASNQKYLGLGMDLEAMARPISPGALALLANRDELAWLRKSGEQKPIFEKLIFCAKESVFKLLYPLVRKRFSFPAISVFPPVKQGQFTFVLRESLNDKFQAGQVFQGWFFSDKDWMLALSWLAPEPG